MKSFVRTTIATAALLLALTALAQQAKKPGLVDAADMKQIVPTNFYYDGQVAPVQFRNAAAVRLEGGKVVQAGLVDNSGYSSDVAAKYQGFFITEKKIKIDGTDLGPGQYGFGFSGGKFRVMDVGGGDVLQVDQKMDESLKRPVPLKIVADGENYRLYCGKKYVVISGK